MDVRALVGARTLFESVRASSQSTKSEATTPRKRASRASMADGIGSTQSEGQSREADFIREIDRLRLLRREAGFDAKRSSDHELGANAAKYGGLMIGRDA